MKIYYLQDASGGFEKFALYLDAITELVQRGGAAVGLHLEKLKKHKDLSLYSIRKNDSVRILLVKYQGQFCLVDVVLNHDYHKSRFYNNLSLFHALLSRSASVVEATSFKDLVKDKETELWEAVEGDERAAFIAAFSSLGSKKAVEYQHGRLIALNSKQEVALSTKLPAIVSGPAGSGKSSLALSMLSQYLRDKEGDAGFPVIYVTQNANLVRKMEEIWHEMVPDVARAACVVFKSYEQMLAEGLHVDQATFVGEKEFLKWYPSFVKSARIPSPIDAKTIWIECRIRSGYPCKEEYLALGRRQSSFNDPAAREFVCRTYDAFLASISPAQSVPVLDEVRGAFVSPYQLFIVDEAQDLSFGQLRRLDELSHAHGSIVFFLGDHQLLYDTKSRLDFLKALYHGGRYEAQVIALDSTYRCSKQVSVVANALIDIKYRITGGASDKLSGMLKAAEDALLGVGEGAAFRYKFNDKAKIDALVEQARSSDQCVVVTLEEHKKEAQELFGEQSLVMTAENVKGLEFDRVILWRLLDCKQATDAARILSPSATPSGHRAKAGVGDTTYEPYCNALITAATRAKNQVIMVQSDNRDIHLILAILDEAFRETQKSGAELSALLPSTREDWVARALELNESGLKQEALGIYLSHLEGSSGTFETFINAQRKKPTVAVLDEVVTTSPTLSSDGTESLRAAATDELYARELGLLGQISNGLTLSDAELRALKKALSSTSGKPSLLAYLVGEKRSILRQMSDDLLFGIAPEAWRIKLGGKRNSVPLLLHLAADEEHGLVILQRLFDKGFVFPASDWEFTVPKESVLFSGTSIPYFLLVRPLGQTIFRQLVNATDSKKDAFDMKKMITASFLMTTPPGHEGISPLAKLIESETGLVLLTLFSTRYPNEFNSIPEDAWKALIPGFTNTSNGAVVLKVLVQKVPKLQEILKKGLKNLWTAASEGDIATIRLYFALGYKLDAIQRSTGVTPAILAVKSGQLDVLEVLNECGVDLNQAMENGITAARMALLIKNLHALKKIFSLCPAIDIVDLMTLAITGDQPEVLSFLIDYSDFFAAKHVTSVKKLMELCRASKQITMESQAKVLITKLLSEGQNASSLSISLMDFAVLIGHEGCIRVLESVTANTAMRSSSEQNENLWTPADLLWLNWIRKQSKASEDLGEGKQLDQMTISDFESFVTETIHFPDAFPADFKDYRITFSALKRAWGLRHHEVVTLAEFQRLMDIFARPESHFLFSVAVHGAFIAARSPCPGGLYQNRIARVEHVAQALLPLGREIFADAVNASIYGGINGAWVGLLPKIKVEELLLADGRIGAFVVGFGEERSCGVVLSYLTNSHVPSDAKPRIVHQSLKQNLTKYLLRGVAYDSFTHAIAHNKSFLKYPCLRASLAVHLGTPEAASITVPQREPLQFRTIETLLHDGCGNIDPTNFNIKFMQRIRDAIHTVLKVEKSDLGAIILNSKALLHVKVQEMLAVTSSREHPLTEFEFNGFHGYIDQNVTKERLNGKPGAYLLRESLECDRKRILAWVYNNGEVVQSWISPASKSPNVVSGGETYSNLDSLLKKHFLGTSPLLKPSCEPYPLRQYSARAVSWNSLNSDRLDSNNDGYLPLSIGSLDSVWNSLKESRERGRSEVLASSSETSFEVSKTEEAEQNESFWTPASLLWLNWSSKLSDGSTNLAQAISMENFEGFVNEMLTFPDSLKPEGHVFKDCKVTFAELKIVWGLSEKREIMLEEFQHLMDIFVRPEIYLSFRGAVRAAFMAARSPFEGDLHKNPNARIEHVAQAMLPTASAIFADAVNSSIFGGLNGAWVGFMSDKRIAEFLRADGRIGAFVVGFSDPNQPTPVISYVASKSNKATASEVRSDPDLIVERETLKNSHNKSGYFFKDHEYMTMIDAVVSNKSLLLYPCIMASLSLRLNDSEVVAMVAPEIEVPLSMQYSALMRAGCGKKDPAHFNLKFMKRIRNALHDVLTIDRNIDNPALQKILFESAAGEIAPYKSALCLPVKVQEVLRLKPNNNFFDGFHGSLEVDQTNERLKRNRTGAYLLRSSLSQSKSCVLAFTDTTGKVQQAMISPSPTGAGVTCSGHKFPSLQAVLVAYSISTSGRSAILSKTIAPYPLDESIARAVPCALLTEVESLPIDDFPPQLCNDLRRVWNSIKHSRDNPLPIMNVAVMGQAFISSASAASALASEAISVQNALDLHGFFSPASLSTAIGSQEQLRGYDIHRVPGDGNCFFHAVADQLQQLGIKDESGALYTHDLLRGLVASSVVGANQAIQEGELNELSSIEGSIKLQPFFVAEELNELSTLKGWVGHEAIQALANLFKVTCIIIRNENTADDVIVPPTGIIVSDDTPVLRLYYNGINHYDSLRNTKLDSQRMLL